MSSIKVVLSCDKASMATIEMEYVHRNISPNDQYKIGSLPGHKIILSDDPQLTIKKWRF